MLTDSPVRELANRSASIYDNGARFQTDYKAEFSPTYGWSTFPTEAALTANIPNWRKLLGERQISFHGASVDLSDAACSTLEDLDGRAWGEKVKLSLENFTYVRIGTPNSGPSKPTLPQVEHRIGWLKQGTDGNYFPQPYAHLAKVFREQGDDDAARRIEEEKILLGIRERAKYQFLDKLARPLWAFYRYCFRYGLSPARASVTVAAFLLAGWAVVAVANQMGMLVMETAPVASVLIKKGAKGTKDVVQVPYSTPPDEVPALRCGTSINQLLYAVDIFIPLLELKEQSHCEVRAVDADDVSPYQAFRHNAESIARGFHRFICCTLEMAGKLADSQISLRSRGVDCHISRSVDLLRCDSTLEAGMKLAATLPRESAFEFPYRKLKVSRHAIAETVPCSFCVHQPVASSGSGANRP